MESFNDLEEVTLVVLLRACCNNKYLTVSFFILPMILWDDNRLDERILCNCEIVVLKKLSCLKRIRMVMMIDYDDHD